jgi:hypothetical protein
MSNEKDIWLSDCCGAEGNGSMIDIGICPDCHEHCEFKIDEVDEEKD